MVPIISWLCWDPFQAGSRIHRSAASQINSFLRSYECQGHFVVVVVEGISLYC